MGPKTLFQGVIGPRQIRDLVAVKQPRPVTARDFQEVHQWRSERPSGSPVSCHGAQQAAQALFDGRPRVLCLVGEDVGCAMYPAIGNAHLRPQRGGLGQPSLENRLQPDQGLW